LSGIAARRTAALWSQPLDQEAAGSGPVPPAKECQSQLKPASVVLDVYG